MGKCIWQDWTQTSKPSLRILNSSHLTGGGVGVGVGNAKFISLSVRVTQRKKWQQKHIQGWYPAQKDNRPIKIINNCNRSQTKTLQCYQRINGAHFVVFKVSGWFLGWRLTGGARWLLCWPLCCHGDCCQEWPDALLLNCLPTAAPTGWLESNKISSVTSHKSVALSNLYPVKCKAYTQNVL